MKAFFSALILAASVSFAETDIIFAVDFSGDADTSRTDGADYGNTTWTPFRAATSGELPSATFGSVTLTQTSYTPSDQQRHSGLKGILRIGPTPLLDSDTLFGGMALVGSVSYGTFEISGLIPGNTYLLQFAGGVNRSGGKPGVSQRNIFMNVIGPGVDSSEALFTPARNADIADAKEANPNLVVFQSFSDVLSFTPSDSEPTTITFVGNNTAGKKLVTGLVLAIIPEASHAISLFALGALGFVVYVKRRAR